MGTINQDIKYRLMGVDQSAGKTFKSVGQEIGGAKSALTSLSQTLGGVNGAFDPLQNAMTAIGEGFNHIKENGKSAAIVMQGVGVGVASAGAALLAFGASAQQAKASLDQTFTDAGFAIGDYEDRISSVENQMARFGHSAADTATGLSKLVVATQNPTKALDLMGTAADIATQKHVSLADASQLLVSALAGNTRVFRAFGINLGSGKLSADELKQALAELQQRIGGTAQAQADTFSGKIKGIAVEFENAAEGLTKYAPALLTIGSIMTVVGSAAQILAARHAAQAVSANAAAVAEERLAAAQGAAAVTAGAETAAVGALDTAQAAGVGIGAAFGASIGGGALLSRLLGPAALTGGTVLAGLGAGLVGYEGTTQVLNHTPLGDAVTHYVGHDLFRRPEAAPTAELGPATLAFLKKTGQTEEDLLAKRDAGLTGKRFSNLNIDAAKAAAQAAASYFQSLTPFAALNVPDNSKMRLTIQDDRQRLADARSNLAAARVGPTTTVDPAAVASARAGLTSARATLTKARYSGSPSEIAADTDRLTAAEARLTKAQEGSTKAAGNVADAEMKVRDARAKLTAATDTYNQTKPLSPGDIFKNLTDEVGNQNKIADAVQRLVHHGLNPTAISKLLDVEKTNPGTIENAASDMSRGYIKQLNAKFHRLKVDSNVISGAMIDKKAAIHAAETNATAYLNALRRRLLVHHENNLGTPSQPFGHPPPAGNTIHVRHMDVHANDPGKLARDTANHSRLKALSP